MGDDRGHTERFTDEELAVLRYVRFGELPRRTAPEELVETTKSDLQREEPAPPLVRREWG